MGLFYKAEEEEKIVKMFKDDSARAYELAIKRQISNCGTLEGLYQDLKSSGDNASTIDRIQKVIKSMDALHTAIVKESKER